jgi:hypothetical protein
MKEEPVKNQPAAVVTIHRPAEMTPEGRRRIARWLLKTAHLLVKSARI